MCFLRNNIIRGIVMDKNVLIGNGINIQFDDKYSSSDIMKRVVASIQADRFTPLTENTLSKEEQIALLEGLVNVVNAIKDKKSAGKADGLIMLSEIERIRRCYPSEKCTITSVPIEDYFLIAEYFNNGFKEEDGEEKSEQYRRIIFTYLKQMILDGIFNDGKINEVHKQYYPRVGSYLDGFDHIFTTNYDYNIEKVVSDSEKVCHLHGEFDKLAPEYDTTSKYYKEHKDECDAQIKSIMPDKMHMYSDCIMSWSWLDKYGDLIKEDYKYKEKLFSSIKGQLVIVGLAPTNDAHIFTMINGNAGIRSVVYYYHSDNDRNEFQRVIQKPVTFKKVDKLWNSLK